MNRPCKITFNVETAPLYHQLPERYQRNVESYGDPSGGDDYVHALYVQNAFPVDFAPHILRTRVEGTKEENPIDFPFSSISFVEWFYGDDVPDQLVPWEPRGPRQSSNEG